MTFFITAFLLILAIMFLMGAWKSFKIWRIVVATPPTRADRIKPGLVAVEGNVVAVDEIITTPYTNRECVYYQFTVEKKRKRNRNQSSKGSQWQRVINDRKSVGCMVQDSYGTIEVELEYADIHLKNDFRTHSGVLKSAPPDLEDMLQERYDLSSKGLVFNRNLRYTEKSLEVGEPVYALGFAREIDGRTVITNEEGYGRDKAESGRRNSTPKMWKGTPSLTVTDKGARHVSLRYLGVAALLGVTGCAFVAIGALVIYGVLGK